MLKLSSNEVYPSQEDMAAKLINMTLGNIDLSKEEESSLYWLSSCEFTHVDNIMGAVKKAILAEVEYTENLIAFKQSKEGPWHSEEEIQLIFEKAERIRNGNGESK